MRQQRGIIAALLAAGKLLPAMLRSMQACRADGKAGVGHACTTIPTPLMYRTGDSNDA